MKPTEDNKKLLRKLGFRQIEEDEHWWRLDNGWSFHIDAIKDFKSLVKRLMKTEYERGKYMQKLYNWK